MNLAQDLARDLGTTDRSIRRALNDGLIRGERPSPRKMLVPARERVYLRAHWSLLSGLRRALRTEPNVKLAVLYGSFARGEADPDSDVDVLVELVRDDAPRAAALRRRLELVVGREVGLARLPVVESGSPLLLAEVLKEGRVLVDRADRWAGLRARRASIERRARRAYEQEMAATRAALDRIDERSEAIRS